MGEGEGEREEESFVVENDSLEEEEEEEEEENRADAFIGPASSSHLDAALEMVQATDPPPISLPFSTMS